MWVSGVEISRAGNRFTDVQASVDLVHLRAVGCVEVADLIGLRSGWRWCRARLWDLARAGVNSALDLHRYRVHAHGAYMSGASGFRADLAGDVLPPGAAAVKAEVREKRLVGVLPGEIDAVGALGALC